jgi:CPA1 family monovalent cation:H+ antiporter
MPKTLETKIAGESLFNDGVGVVVFIVLVGIAGGESASVSDAALLFVWEALGGGLFGFIIGFITYRMLKNVDDHSVEILLTLALVCGGYALATYLHISGPIAVVMAGLMIGNYGRRFAMSEKTRDHLDKFWELIDEILNYILFVWIGLEIMVLSFAPAYLVAGLMAILLVLAARFTSVSSAVSILRFRRQFSRNAIKILTWGGLRGGISIALALSLAPSAARDLIVSTTYVVVVFSILVQGLTIKRVAGAR